MSRLPSVRRVDTPYDGGGSSPTRPLTEREIACTRAVVHRYCQVMRVPGDEHRILAALGIEEER